jgi:hypothetical protein
MAARCPEVGASRVGRWRGGLGSSFLEKLTFGQ